MNLRTFFIVLAFALLALFALLNWSAFSTPTELTLGIASVQAPLGWVMLVVTGLVSALFVLYIVIQQAGLIAESRRFAKDLQAQRELADKAEASRLTELHNYLARELRLLGEQRLAGESEQTVRRLDQMEQRLSEKLDETVRVLSAYIGEVDDKLDRSLGSPPS